MILAGTDKYQPGYANHTRVAAFSLLEVMIACGILFMAVFIILALVSSTLRNARSLRRMEVDAGMVAAQMFKTNRIYEGKDSGDFGETYQGYSWDTEAFEVETNGLWQVDITVLRRGNPDPVDRASIFIFSPESSSGPARGGGRR
jgi:Tfp pilus assembly protein PilV